MSTSVPPKYNPKELLESLSKYAEYLEKEGVDTKSFYYNRSRIFLSISAHSLNRNRRSNKTLLLFLFVSLARLLKGLFSFTKVPKILIIDTREYYGDIFKKEGITYDNTILAYLYDRLDFEKIGLIDRFNLPFDNPEFQSNGWKFTKNISGRKRLYEELILFKYLLTHPFSWRGVKKEVQDQKKLLKNLTLADGRMAATHQGFLHYLELTKFFLWKEEAYAWYLGRKSIDRVLILDEYSPNQRSILNACKRQGIESVALQHGGMHELHPGYVYGPEDRRYNIFPDRFLSWGSSFTDFLKKNNWPDIIQEVGHLRTDMIPTLKSRNTPNKQLVVFISQPHKDELYSEKIAKLVFQTFKGIQNAELILRPHPREIDTEKYSRWSHEVGFANFRMDKTTELYVLMSKASVLITSFSTVGQEAIYFDVPVLTVDPLERDIASYVKEEVAKNATDSSELEDLVQKVLAGTKLNQEKREEYINKYAYKVDGKVHLRIKNILLSEV